MKNSKKIYKSIMLIMVVAIITFILTTTFLYNKLATKSIYANILDSNFVRKIYTLKKIIDSEYISDANEGDLIDGAIRGYVEGLGDEYLGEL